MVAKTSIYLDLISEYKNKGAKQAEASFVTLEKSAARLAKTFGVAFGSAALLGFGAKAVKLAAEEDKQFTTLNNTLQNLGLGFASVSAKPFIQSLALATGITVDKLIPAYQDLLVATSNVSQSQADLKTAMDVSIGTGNDLATVTAAIAKGYLGNFKGIKALGAGVDSTLIKIGRMDLILKQLSSTWQGTTAAFASGTAGSMARLQERIHQTTVSIGEKLTPAFLKLLTFIDNSLIPAFTKLSKTVSENKGPLEVLASALGALWIAPKIDALLTAIGAIATAWKGVGTAAAGAATAEGTAIGLAGNVRSLLTNPITAMVAIGAGVGYEFYKAGTDQGPPQKPVIGGKGGAAAMARYKKDLAAYNAKQAGLAPTGITSSDLYAANELALKAQAKVLANKAAQAKLEAKILADQKAQTLQQKQQALLKILGSPQQDFEMMNIQAALQKNITESAKSSLEYQLLFLQAQNQSGQALTDSLDKLIIMKEEALIAVGKVMLIDGSIVNLADAKNPFAGFDEYVQHVLELFAKITAAVNAIPVINYGAISANTLIDYTLYAQNELKNTPASNSSVNGSNTISIMLAPGLIVDQTQAATANGTALNINRTTGSFGTGY